MAAKMRKTRNFLNPKLGYYCQNGLGSITNPVGTPLQVFLAALGYRLKPHGVDRRRKIRKWDRQSVVQKARRKHRKLHSSSTPQVSTQFSDRKPRDSSRNVPVARLEVEVQNLQSQILIRPRANKNLFLISLIPQIVRD